MGFSGDSSLTSAFTPFLRIFRLDSDCWFSSTGFIAQSVSKVLIKPFTTFGSRTITPTSRRESSSAWRRLWLPTKA